MPEEGYAVFLSARHTAAHAAATLATLRRYDRTRPAVAYGSDAHADALRRTATDGKALADGFDRVEVLGEAHRDEPGFWLHLDRFKPFERTLYVDGGAAWCRNPDPLWTMLALHPFTAAGAQRPAFALARRDLGGVWPALRDRRRVAMRAFGLTHLPHVLGVPVYAHDDHATRSVCATARALLARRHETPFCEGTWTWSLAAALSRAGLSVLEAQQGHASPRLDYAPGAVQHDPDFEDVAVRCYPDALAQALAQVRDPARRAHALRLVSALPGRGDYLDATPFILHFDLPADAPDGSAGTPTPWDAFAVRTAARAVTAAGLSDA